MTGTYVFTAIDAEHGQELWVTDGTDGGTRLLRDIYPGIQGSLLGAFTPVGDGLTLFTATDPAHGRELWVTDGTTGGTRLLKDIWVGSSSNPGNFVRLPDGSVLFNADDGVNGNELWRTDGTPEGTALLKDMTPGAASSYARARVALDDSRYVFGVFNDLGAGSLWVTDGTTDGTTSLKAVSVTSYSMASIGGGKAIFGGSDSADGSELWVTDGTAAGTKLIKDINPGAAGSNIYEFTPLGNGKAIFRAYSSVSGFEAWVTDGTADGTSLIKDIYPAGNNSYPQSITSLGNGKAVFTAYDDGHGLEMWVTDGTSDGTFLLKDIHVGLGSSGIGNIAALSGGKAIFSAYDGGNGYQLWTTDGTTAGTVPLTSASNHLSYAQSFTLLADGRALFTETDAANGRELWVTDGTVAGTSLLKDIRPGVDGSNPANFTAIADGGAFFTAYVDGKGYELFKTDGTASGTQLVKDINTSTTNSGAYGFTAVAGGKAVFSAYDEVHGYELWSTDGTEAGTSLVKDVIPGRGGWGAQQLTSLGDGKAVYSGYTSETGAELWITDGSEAGTTLVADLRPGASGSSPSEIRSIGGGKAVFAAGDEGGSINLWVTDGTAGGTTSITSLYGYSDLRSASDGGTAFYLGYNGYSGYTYGELWVTDGTVDGTYQIGSVPANNAYDLTPLGNGAIALVTAEYDYWGGGQTTYHLSVATSTGVAIVQSFSSDAFGNAPAGLTSLGGGKFAFTMQDVMGQISLWVSNGTSAGTMQIGPAQYGSSGIASLGDGRAIFGVRDDDGIELWITDGTAAGTTALTDIASGSAYFQQFASFGSGHALFTTYDAVNRFSLWTTDGSVGGTRLLANNLVQSPTITGNSFGMLPDGRAFFQAYDDLTGAEPWVTDGTAAGTHRIKDINLATNSSQPYGYTKVTPRDTQGVLTLSGLTNGAAREGTAIVAGVTDPNGLSGAITYTFTDVSDPASPVVLQTGSSASYTPGYDAAGKTISVTASYQDDEGFTASLTTSAGTVVNVDISAPDTSIVLKPAALTKSTTATFAFGGADDVGIVGYEVSLDGGAFQAASGATFQASNLSDGGHMLSVRARDAAGNVDTTPSTYAWTIDATAPVAPTVALANDTGSSNRDLITRDVTLLVTPSEPGGSILYRLDSGAYLTSAPTVMADGKHNILVYQRDAAGNLSASSQRLTFTLDTTPAEITITTAPRSSNSRSQLITGTGEVGTTVTILDGATSLGTAVVGANGVWSRQVTLTAGVGDHTITAKGPDIAGNVGVSAPVVITYDLTAPPAPTVALRNDTGSSATDGLTRDWTLDVTPTEAGSTILYRLDNGAYVTSLPSSIADGKHNILAYERDAAGNVSASSQRLSFTLDTTAPIVAITSSGGPVTSAAQTIAGTGEAGTIVTVFDGSTALGTATVASNGKWSRAVTLSGEGQHLITAQDVDKAGNIATSAAVTYDLTTGASLNRMIQAMAVAPSSASSSSPSAQPKDEPRPLIAAAH